MRRSLLWLLAVAAAVIPPPARGQTEPTHVLRLATQMPRTPIGRRGLARWNRRLAELTDGRLQVQMYWGGAMGNERTMVRRLRIAALDGASLTSMGLGMIHRPVMVMQAPGVFSTYAQVDAVRADIGPELARGIESEGFHLLGFGDAGRVRLFSQGRPVQRPADLRRMRPWVPRSDSIFRQVLHEAGANGVPLSVGEVFGSLRTHTIDVVPSTAIAAAGLQWFTSLDHVTAGSDGFLIGGMVVRQGFVDGLSQADRDALDQSATENHERLLRGIRRGDERAYQALLRRGLSPVDTEPYRSEWEQLARRTRRALVGRVYPSALLARVERVAGAAR
ncbi:MAG: TRAP transporter substrate-binding protein DctP [Sandaracinaceae bacterium]